MLSIPMSTVSGGGRLRDPAAMHQVRVDGLPDTHFPEMRSASLLVTRPPFPSPGQGMRTFLCKGSQLMHAAQPLTRAQQVKSRMNQAAVSWQELGDQHWLTAALKASPLPSRLLF